MAGIDYFLVGLDVFEYFDHHQIGREKRNVVSEQKIAGTVDEHGVSRGNFFKADQEGGIHHGSRCKFEIQSIARVLNAIAKKQFVSEQFTRAIQDGLASQIFHLGIPSRSIKCRMLRHWPKREGGW